ncbi:hypothetical protein TKK_0018519 [Trichogramma kaykai]|uniref:General transcription factor 3C polypeptide 3 n=1 Tax=Trichogramma kaykai TaxID=54128 RepID=A0ABD2VY74_9HYME
MDQVKESPKKVDQESSEKTLAEPDNIVPNIIVADSSVLQTIELEEIDATSANYNSNEFVPAEIIKIYEVPVENEVDVCYETAEETPLAQENILTRQFLDGELSLSDLAEKIDQNTQADEEIDYNAPVESVPTEINESKNSEKKDVKPVIKRRHERRVLPQPYHGLMGQANECFAKGQIQTAIQMCMEVIRNVPKAPNPYQTLAQIYEQNEPEKSLQFSLIAAHLNPKNDLWEDLAKSSLNFGNVKQAIICYTKAIENDPKNIELYETRAQLQSEFLNDQKAKIKAYSKLLNYLGPEDGPTVMKYAKLLFHESIKENLNQIAFNAMEHMLKKCPELVTYEELNLFAELLLLTKNFSRCLDVLVEFTPVTVEYGSIEVAPGTNRFNITLCMIPDDLAVDLKTKCIVALLELGASEIVDELVARFREIENVEDCGDQYLDIAEAFMDKGEFERALLLLEPMVNSETYSLAAVWLRHAECWVGCGDNDRAIKSYEIVRKLGPQHLGARIELSKLYKAKGQFKNAIAVLEQDPYSQDKLDASVLYERVKLLYKAKRYDEYFRDALLLLSRHSLTVRTKMELTSIARSTNHKARVEILQRDRLSRGEPVEEPEQLEFCNANEPSEKEEFLLVMQMCKTACRLGKYGILQRVTFTALTSKRFSAENDHLMYLALLSCIRNADSYSGFNVVREIVRSRNRNQHWNLLNIIIQKAEDSRHNRFMMRQLGKEDAFSYLHILHANNCLVSGTYKYALNDYISLFKTNPSSLLALLIAVTLLQMACQKFSGKKNQLVVQSLGFMKTYMELRGKECEQESNYNMGRVMHQLGLLPSAMHFYKLVLTKQPSELVKSRESLLDLRKEAAFNLHLIYMQSGNPEMARMYLEDYITI